MTRISCAETRLEGVSAVRGLGWMAAPLRDALRVRSRGMCPRLTRLSVRIVFSLVVVALLAPALGYAAPRDVTIRWNPSPTGGVVDYVLSVGTSSRNYTGHMSLSSPSVSGNVWSQTVQLEDSADQYVALRAVNSAGQYSVYSNEIVIAGGGGAPPPPSEPDFGVTSLQGIPSVASDLIFVEALADAGTESVEFRLDDVLFNIENGAPYAFNSDNGPGALIGWDTHSVSDGFHTISATGFSQDDAGGEMGRSVSVTFEVSNGAAAPEPLGVPGKPMLVVD